MRKATFSERLRYRFDNFMSRGTIALIGGLAVVSLLVILVAGLLISLTGFTQEGSEPLSFSEAAWESLMRTLDSGTMGGDTGWGFRLVMLGVTLGGIFIISTLIGVLSNGIEDKLAELRKGRSTVIESDHTVILGWSPQIFAILSELIIANANHRDPCLVILADRDKVEMEDEIQERVGETGNTRIVCRTGNPIDISDLNMVSLQTARSIIVVAAESDDPDTNTIKTLLAIVKNPRRRPQPYHIVAEIRDPNNLSVAKMVGGDEAALVMLADLISRITVQTCRQSGLSVVYTELLDFGGDEIYFKTEPALVGKTFGEVLLSYEDSAVIGLRQAQGGVRLNPPMDTLIAPGDQIIAISEDDDTIHPSGLTDVGLSANAIRGATSWTLAPERTLILGWNWRVPTIINELDAYVAPGSGVTVVADVEDGETLIAENCQSLKNETIAYQHDDPTDRRTLDSLDIPGYDHVIVLCSDRLEQQQADAKTLITLLHLRDIADKLAHPFSIVSEMLDTRNRELAEVTRPDDFIVSERLVSLILSQVSENKELKAVFDDLFDPEGSEIYLKPVGNYVATGEAVNFYTVVESARRKGEVAIGYRLKAMVNAAEKAYGVVVNPDKSEKVVFTEGDKIIVLAEQ